MTGFFFKTLSNIANIIEDLLKKIMCANTSPDLAPLHMGQRIRTAKNANTDHRALETFLIGFRQEKNFSAHIEMREFMTINIVIALFRKIE